MNLPQTRVLPILLLAGSLFLSLSTKANAWDGATHRLITRLAIAALPPSPLKTAFTTNERELEQHSVEPDSILKDRYGKAEEIHHYIDLEVLNPNPQTALTNLDPDLSVMRQRMGEARLEASGTLPWAIQSTATQFSDAWRNDNCTLMLRKAGYLSHYVGDASQPLHSTIHFDGYRRDRGIHQRIEGAVDDRISSIEAPAAKEVKLETITAVWPAEIAEIRRANAQIHDLIEADRKARKTARKGPQYDTALLEIAAPILTTQIADAASTLASIWLYEWKSAGSPPTCQKPN